MSGAADGRRAGSCGRGDPGRGHEPPFAALDGLLVFERVRWPPLVGATARLPAHERWLLELAGALAAEDAPRADRALAALRAAPAAWAALAHRWWLGADAFLGARLEALGQLDAVAAPAQRVLRAGAFAARSRHAAHLIAVADVVAALRPAGIEPLLLKGLSVAHALYPEPWSRPCGDVDVLVARGALGAALERLAAAGWTEAATERGETWTGHRHAAPRTRDVDGHPVCVEVHDGLGAGSGERLGYRALAARSTRMQLGTERVAVLHLHDSLAHLALHHPGELRFRSVLDVVLAARAAGPDGLRAARARLPRGARWQLDLLAQMAAELARTARVDPRRETSRAGRAPTARVVPRWRGALVEACCGPGWGARFVAERRLRDAAPRAAGAHPAPLDVAAVAAAPFRAMRQRAAEHGLVAAHVLARELRTVPLRLSSAARLLGDVSVYIFPAYAAFTRSSGRRGALRYLLNSARAARSLVGRLLGPLSGRAPRSWPPPTPRP